MNKKKILGLFILFIILSAIFTLTQQNQEIDLLELEQALVINIIDGDTLEVKIGTTKQTVRLLGVDAAETEFNDDIRTTKRECFSLEARDELKRLTLNKKVTLENDPLNENIDDYGRILRYVYLFDGTFINQKLIEGGFARHLSFFPITKNKDFAFLESAAQSQNLGLWNACPK